MPMFCKTLQKHRNFTDSMKRGRSLMIRRTSDRNSPTLGQSADHVQVQPMAAQQRDLVPIDAEAIQARYLVQRSSRLLQRTTHRDELNHSLGLKVAGRKRPTNRLGCSTMID